MGAAKLSWLGPAFCVLLAACEGCTASSPSPSSSAGLLNCSLPVIRYTRNVVSFASQNGFISVPSGTFEPETAGNGSTYDRPYRRWLPVVAAHVLPDGSAYAYEMSNPPYEIHMVRVTTGVDTVIYRMPYDNAFSILALKPEGVYVIPILHRSGIPVGLWLLSSTTGTLTAVPAAGTSHWQVIEGGAAWGGPVGGDRIDRLDLSTGVFTTWFQHAIAQPPGIGVNYGPGVIGFDLSGRPLIQFAAPVDTTASPARTPRPELWLASSPTQASKLTGLPLPDGFLRAGVTDSHGTWLVGSDGFYLYTDAGFRRAAPMPPGPGNSFEIAGSCA